MKALSQPLFASLRGYDRAQLGPDLFSGALIALLSIPISMGYAQLAGLPPVYGLYGSLVPILLFAMLSTTREFIFGVDAAPAAMIGAVLASLGVTPGGAEAMRIVPVLTLYVALWLAVFALVHADKAVDYISEPVMGGFISGVCCEIILMQVPKLLGSATGTGELFELLGHVFDAAKVINWPTAALGFGTLAILLIAPRKWPKVPWVLVMMVLGGLLGAFSPLDDWGVALLAAEAAPRAGEPGDGEAFDFDALRTFEFVTREVECQKCANHCEIICVYRDGKIIDSWGNRCDKGAVKAG